MRKEAGGSPKYWEPLNSIVLNSGTSVAELLYCHRRTGYLGLYQIAQRSKMKDVVGRGHESFFN